MKELLLIFSVTVIIVFVILLSTGLFSNNHSKNSNQSVSLSGEQKINLDDPKQVRTKYGIKEGINYILPQEFKVGLTKPREPYFMNNCNSNVLYPINGLGPDYGKKMPDCRCTEFVQPP